MHTNKFKANPQLECSDYQPSKIIIIQIVLLNAIFLTIAILFGLSKGNIKAELGELGLITWISVCQLLFISGTSFKLFTLNNNTLSLQSWKSSQILWVIIAMGFIFLALDELIHIHDMFGKQIAQFAFINNPKIASRIDDLIIVVYFSVGIIFLYFFRNEIEKHTKVKPLFLVGFLTLFVMVGIDIIPSRIVHFLSIIFHTPYDTIRQTWLPLAKDATKLFTESFFIAGFYNCFQIEKRRVTKIHNTDK